MAGESALIAEWHCMQVDALAICMVSPEPALGWHILHFSFTAPACARWLNGMGCSGAAFGAWTSNSANMTSIISGAHLFCQVRGGQQRQGENRHGILWPLVTHAAPRAAGPQLMNAVAHGWHWNIAFLRRAGNVS